MRLTLVWLLCVLCFAGCSDSVEPKKEVVGAKTEVAPKGPPPPPPSGQADLDYPRGGRVEISENDEKFELTERVKAEVGVGSKGRRLEDPDMVKMIVTPAIALFRTRERVVFEIQIPKAIQLYEALNNKKLASTEAFMEHIIRANKIDLPSLPAGQKYIYDPEKGELMVEKPVNNN